MTKTKITTISGSSRKDSSNDGLLKSLSSSIFEFEKFELKQLPTFHPDFEDGSLPEMVKRWRQEIKQSSALIISTPEYLHNIPAILKNAFEWLATSGELKGKPVLPIVFTPHPPRGEKAMQSLIWTLQALDANIITSVNLYKSDFKNESGRIVFEGDGIEILQESIKLLPIN